MNTDPSQNRLEFQNLVILAKEHLHLTQANPPPDLGPDSLAQLAFDPCIGRRLQMATPIRIVPPPTFQQTCKTLGRFLDGLYEIGILETVDELTTWEVSWCRTNIYFRLIYFFIERQWGISDRGYLTHRSVRRI
jgi:hypothetical protein